jgi:hypothetical protein
LEVTEWITRISRDEPDEDKESIGFRPAKPLKTYTLSRFRSSIEGLGKSEMLPHLLRSDPLLEKYRDALRWHENEAFLQSDIQELLEGSTTASA